MTSTTFSTRSNAKRAAEKAIDDGTAPSIAYGLHSREDGRVEIVWHRNGATEDVQTTEQAEAEAAEDSPQRWPSVPGPIGYRDRLLAADAARRQTMAGPAEPAEGCTVMIVPSSSAPSGDRKPSRRVELDMLAATGIMPAKPIITSKANQLYQKRFDQLEKWAMADDWAAIRGYEVHGVNSYAKMVKQYRDRLLAAHAATQ